MTIRVRLHCYYCVNQDYSDQTLPATVSHKLLHVRGDKLEVKLKLWPEVKGQSDGRMNVAFLDRDESKQWGDRKYYAYASWRQRQILKIIFGKQPWQQAKNQWQFVLLVVGFLLGLLLPPRSVSVRIDANTLKEAQGQPAPLNHLEPNPSDSSQPEDSLNEPNAQPNFGSTPN